MKAIDESYGNKIADLLQKKRRETKGEAKARVERCLNVIELYMKNIG